MNKSDFERVAAAAISSVGRVLDRWLPGGKYQGVEYVALNPTRADSTARSFSINTDTGVWCDFSTNEKGGDLISLVAYVDRVKNGEACSRLAQFLSVDLSATPAPTQAPAKSPGVNLQWIPILPVPDNALASCPARHSANGEPVKVWEYLDSGGRLLMKVCRFSVVKNGVTIKDYRPLTYCYSSASKGHKQWRWQAPAKNRPLYGLDKLAARPAAPVLLCEGEKAADAAQVLLPDCISMTWPNGSKATNKADFSPLKGRDVLLWPDNDQPGRECMQNLAALLVSLGCKVQLIELAVFGDAWPAKGDAADALECGFSAERLQQLMREGRLCVPFQPRSKQPVKKASDGGRDDSGSRFTITDGGVFYRVEDGGVSRVCDRLDILAQSRDKNGMNWGLLVQFKDPDGTQKVWNIPKELLVADGGSEILKNLQNMGLGTEPGPNPRRRLIEYLQTASMGDRVVLVNRIGWHDSAFLLPDRVIGNPKEPLYFHSPGSPLSKIGTKGSLDAWRNDIAALCVGNHRLIFAVCCAFGAPLLELIGAESCGFHFYGDSSQGKTTLLRVAASVYGGPDYVRTWRSTDNALESIAASHSDCLLILDEIGQCDPRIIGESIYMLGNGQGKARLSDRAIARSLAEWRLIFLSTGEKTLEEHIAEVGKKIKAGMDMRLLAIPSDAGAGLGIFNDTKNFAGGAALSGWFVEKSASSHGVAFHAFIEALAGNSSLTKLATRIRQAQVNFAGDMLSDSASGQARRAADKFALIGFAGELASHAGITGWSKGEALNAAKVCFNAWLAQRGGEGNQEDLQILKTIKLFFERYGESRFTRWGKDQNGDESLKIDDHAARTMDRCGFRQVIEHRDPLEGDTFETIYYVTPGAWDTEICKGLNTKRANQLLADMGALLKDASGKNSIRKRLPGTGKTATRVYAINPAKIVLPNEGIEVEEAAA